MRRKLLLLGLLAFTLLLGYCWYDWLASTHSAKPASPPSPAVIVESHHVSAHAGDASLYPDPALTPGDVIAGVTAADVCTPYYTKRVRSVSQSERDQVYANYKTANVPKQHELDHFISLELGGSNSPSNLWPEPYEPRPGAHEKDRVENYLHRQVCSGKITLEEAQKEIATDWYAIYLMLPAKR
jgi:hypothetical protein